MSRSTGGQPSYRPVDARVAWPELEARIRRTWTEKRVYERSLSEREGRPEWVFYEGPPTANGRPGIHHVQPRAVKDLFCRFQTMRGHYVHRKGGWDCHGLPVEVEVEKQLGITHKRQIEQDVGIEEFTRLCRESVQRYVDDWERFTGRLGFWVDLDDAYWTMSRGYIETVWWLLKQIWDKGLLEEDFKVVPYCPRCETSLSAHEQHQPDAYKQVTDPSVYVRFPLADEPSVALLIWTTTPWTLLANMAAAVGPSITYVRVADPYRAGHDLIVAKERAAALMGQEVRPKAEMSGADLLGRRYSPPFAFVASGEQGHRVVPGDFVTTDDGSGIVHLAPYGQDDMAVARRDGLPIEQMVDPSGNVVERGIPFAGMYVKDADPRIIENLEGRRLLFRSEDYEHSYPHCWRCRTPLLYYPRLDWYIRTSQMRAELQASNEDVNWQPATIKYGRFGDWLANNVDWSLSRDRYWGTPLPIWRCEEGHATCVGSFAELSELTGADLGDFEPHRPYVDDITFDCPRCTRTARRVLSVIDGWFDSGSMPFGQWHYPFENEEVFERRFPADFISEGMDQTRGWFYSLLAVSTLVRGQSSFKNCVVGGLMVDASGRKMSKSLGNVIDPWTVFDTHGADALRWYLLTGGTPWAARRISMDIVQEALRKHLLTLWNTYSFWVTYAALEGFDPSAAPVAVAERPEMDRWILAELDDAVRTMTADLEDFDTTRSGHRLERFVDDLSNWYVRRSRRRFWRSSEDADTRSAFLTLWECLVTVAKLAAPYTPFVAEEIFSNLAAVDPREPDSVHLALWPEPDDLRADDGLRARMALARRLVTLGRSARTDAKVRVRQPLRRALVVMPLAEREHLTGLERLVGDELNVKEIEVAHGLEELVTYSVKPNFKLLGPRFGASVGAVAGSLAAADAAALVAKLEGDGVATIDVEGRAEELKRAEVDVRVEGRTGFVFAQDGPYGVALDVALTPELVAEGSAREVVRAVQDLRKAGGLAVQDRIELWLDAAEDGVAAALTAHRDGIADEVLAASTHVGEAPPEGLPSAKVPLDGGVVSIAIARVNP
ncbi:MAG: isoleucine--tRNA ligase [Actinobacteria bacterium]|nr:isoleucine--tRNA ligase [Actinomycetota bacterium]